MASVDACMNKRRSRSEPPAGYKYANSESTPSIYNMKRKPYLVSKVDITQVQDFLLDAVQILKSQERRLGMYKETPRISCFCWPTYGEGKDPPPSVHHPLSKYFCSTNMCNMFCVVLILSTCVRIDCFPQYLTLRKKSFKFPLKQNR